MSSSIASNNPKIMGSFVRTRRYCMTNHRWPAIYQSQLKNPQQFSKSMFQVDQQPNLINVSLLQNGKKVNKLAGQEKQHGDDDDELVKEFKELLQRLEGIMEEWRVLEMEKFMCRIKGEMISVEEQKEVAEVLSREMVHEVLERPFKYFSREDVKLKDKLNDLKLLVRMFEQSSSCLRKNQQGDVSNKKNNSLCLRHYLN